MSRSDGDSDLGPLVADLVTTLREIESEFEPRTESGLPRPPSPRELVRFTSDVGIPAAILLLRTNIEALRLLQRALRMADGRPPTTGAGSTEVRRRAEQLSKTTLSRLDGALADLQEAVEGTPQDEDARDLIEEARALRADVERKLADGTDGSGEDEASPAGDESDDQSVPVDVDAELRSIKDEFDANDGHGSEDGGENDGDEDDGDE